MRLKVLMDNSAVIDQYYLAEPALSFLLQDAETRILFDTGYSSAYLANAKAMGEDLSRLNAIVISHGHDDHSAGLRHWLVRFGSSQNPDDRPELVAHPSAFNPKRSDKLDIGSPLGLQELSRHFTLRLSTTPQQLTPRFVFLGEIPRTNPYEGLQPIGETTAPPIAPPDAVHTPTYNPAQPPVASPATDPSPEPHWIPDQLPDDSALVYKGDDGLVIITGCSHAGIVNIVEYAIKVCGDTRINDIIGGYHLLDASPQRLNFTRERLAALAPRAMHPCHCTDLAAKIHLAHALPVKELGVSMKIDYH
jgi:7,8-dihydropterin-6-yl-methyl-4-(beta-D-ribofuranosyl)aminobenzene 5'-phosphate synthase